MNASEHGAFLQATQETSLKLFRYGGLRKSTGWFRSPEAARPSWTYPKRPIALATLAVPPGEVFATKYAGKHLEIILLPGRVRYPNHEYITAQSFTK